VQQNVQITYLNKLKIVENTKKKKERKIKISIAKGPCRDSRAPSWLSGHWRDVPAEPLSHRPCVQSYKTAHVYYYGIIKIKHMFMFILYVSICIVVGDQFNKRLGGGGVLGSH